jgi:hypothetical protein
MSVWMILLIVFGGMMLLGIGSCVVCVGMVGKAASDAQNSRPGSTAGSLGSPKGPPAPTTPPMTVSAKQLYADYHANEVAADEKYKGKNLLVSGTIVSIDKDAFDNMQLRLSVGDQFGLEYVMATLDDSQKGKAMALAKGKSVTVVGRGGTMIMGSPTLDDCVLQ